MLLRAGGGGGLKLQKSKSSIALLGDSYILRDAGAVVGADFNVSSYAVFLQTNMFLGWPFHIDNIDGINGTDSGSFLTRLPATLAFKTKYVFIQGSVNDIQNGLTYAQSKSNYATMFKMCNDYGATVITNTVPPNTFCNNAAKQSQWNELNNWLLDSAPNLYDAIVLPYHWAYLDPTLLTSQPLLAQAPDGVHPDCNGAFLLTQASIPVLSKLIYGFAPMPVGDTATGADVNIHPNPINVGIGGTLGAGVAGQVSDNMGVRVTAGGAANCTKVARTDGPGAWQQIVYTPSAIGQICEYYNTGPAIGLGNAQVGDVVSLFQEFEVDSASAGYRWCTLQLTFNGSGKTATFFPLNGALLNMGVPATTKRGTMQTPPFAIPAGTTGFFVDAMIQAAGAGTASTIRFGNAGFRNYSKV